MEMTVRQEPFTWHYRYRVHMDGRIRYRAQASRRLLPWPRWLQLTDPAGRVLIYMRQEPFWRALAEWVPFLPVSCPFRVFSPEGEIGVLEGRPWGMGATGTWQGRRIALGVHSGYVYSVWLDMIQVAEVRRSSRVQSDADHYTVRFDSDVDPAMVAALTVFTDLFWHTLDNELHLGVRYEWEWNPRLRPAPAWQPKDRGT